MEGDTLGCRIYHALAASTMDPVAECVRAGPGGDLIAATPPAFCSGGDVCESFCKLEIRACGSVQMPLPGNPKEPISHNPLYQYQNVDNCMRLCDMASIDKTQPYTLTAMGDSLACRLVHAIDAAVSLSAAMENCAYTAFDPVGPCEGPAGP
jgi:hypothetical protein